MEYMVTILVAIVVGLAVGIVVRRRCEANANNRVETLKKEYEASVDALKKEHLDAMEREKKQWNDTLRLQVEAMQGTMSKHFGEEMEGRSQALKKENHEQMDNILRPMREKLEELQRLMRTNSTQHTEQITTLKTSIELLTRHDDERDKTTRDLANALKNRGKVQGDWGEQVLENILRESGLREGEEFVKQKNVVTDEGDNMRPDVVVRLTDGSAIVIDSKVSLSAYTDYVGAETDDERQDAIKRNKDAIWAHVVELSNKHYEKEVRDAVPLVLMFVPNEGSYILAMNADPQLGIKSWRKHVIIINPTNLMAILNLISVTWQNTRQEKNVRDILDTAQRIYDKYATFADTFVRLGSQLDTTRRTYDVGIGQLREGKGNLSKHVQDLLRMGVAKTKDLPETIEPLNDSEEE